MNSKLWRYAAIAMLLAFLGLIAFVIWFVAQSQGSVIVDAPAEGDITDVTFDEQPASILVNRDGRGRILIIPSGKQIGVECEEDGETLVLSIPVGGNGSSGTILCAVVDPTSTPSPTDEPGPTSTPDPTDEPEPTETAVPPTPTDEPEPTATAVGSLPLCEDHDPNAYHGLVSEDGSCHYNHTHGSDFASLDWLADETDSPWPLDYGIGYAHETPGENADKHTGYINLANSTAPNLASDDFECVIDKAIPGIDGCVVAWRIQTHTVGGERALMVRIHSNYGQVWIQNPDGSIGSISAGGWGDWGHLMVPYKTEIIDAPQDGPLELAGIFFDEVHGNMGQPPYRAGEVQTADGQPGRYAAQWNLCSNAAGANNPSICFDFTAFGDFGGVDTADGLQEWMVCPDGSCDNNHSTFRLHEVIAETPPELGNGLINFEGWTDLHGNIVDESECVVNEYGVFPCAPIIIRNVQAGKYAFRTSVGTNGSAPPDDGWTLYFDESPENEQWIVFPYR